MYIIHIIYNIIYNMYNIIICNIYDIYIIIIMYNNIYIKCVYIYHVTL